MTNHYSKNIFSTICYFDLFDHPLSAFEIWVHLFVGNSEQRNEKCVDHVTWNKVRVGIDELVVKHNIATKHGFYFLPGRERIVRERRARYLIGIPKWNRAVFASKLIRWVPYVRMVAVANTLAMDAAKETSDIDLLIVLKKGRIWMARLFITLLIGVWGIRRHGKKIANRICLSFYITDDALNLKPIAIKPFDIYLIYYITQVVVLYENSGIKKKFFQENKWVATYIPHFQPFDIADPRKVKDSRFSKWVRVTLERFLSGKIGSAFETFVRKTQMHNMKIKKQDTIIKKNTNIVISDTMLKFHEKDRRKYFYREFLKRLKTFH